FETLIKGSIQDAASANPALKLELQAGPFDVKDVAGLSSMARPYEPSGQITLRAQAQGTLKALGYSGTVILENLKAKYENYLLEGIGGSVRFSQNQVEVPRLAGKLGVQGKGGTAFDIQTTVTNFSAPDITLNANFDTLDLGMFMGEGKKEGTA